MGSIRTKNHLRSSPTWPLWRHSQLVKRKLCFTSLRGPRKTHLEVHSWVCLACSWGPSPQHTHSAHFCWQVLLLPWRHKLQLEGNFRLSPPLLARRTKGDKNQHNPLPKDVEKPCQFLPTPPALGVDAVMQNSTYPLMASQTALQPRGWAVCGRICPHDWWMPFQGA